MKLTNHKQFNKEEHKHGSYLLPYSIYKTQIPDYFTAFPMHWHEEIEIIQNISGCSKYVINFEEYIIQEGDILIIPPTSLHSFEEYNNKSFSGFTFIFDQKMINSSVIDACSTKYIMPLFNNEITFPIHIKACDSHNKPLTKILESIKAYHFNQPAAYELYMKIAFLSFVHYFFEHNLFQRNTTGSGNTRTADFIKSVTTYIENHYGENISLELLAGQINISVYHLSHIFKRFTGQTPIEYLNHYRLTMSSQLLISSDSSIMDISIACGYNNVSYFNRIFKAKYGITPKEYRKRNKK